MGAPARRAALLAWLWAAPASSLPPAAADRRVLEGLEAGYALDFDAASDAFEEADRLAPEHPAGPFFRASLVWLEFSLEADVPGKGAALETRFERLLDEAFRRARLMREADPRSAEAEFYLGAAHGMRGRWRIVESQWLRAAAEGWRSYRHLAQAVRLDPDLYDAYLGLGMYDYYSDRIPALFKIASWLIVRGDKDRGLRFVRMAVAKGHYSVLEGQLFLVAAYTNYEKEPGRALDILRDLRLGREDSLFFLYLEASARLQAKDWKGCAEASEALVSRAAGHPHARRLLPLFELYLADAYLGAKDYAKARATASRCVETARVPHRALVTFCLLRRAQASDLLGEREAALRDYAEAEAREEWSGSRRKARLGLASPADYERVVSEFIE